MDEPDPGGGTSGGWFGEMLNEMSLSDECVVVSGGGVLMGGSWLGVGDDGGVGAGAAAGETESGAVVGVEACATDAVVEACVVVAGGGLDVAVDVDVDEWFVAGLGDGVTGAENDELERGVNRLCVVTGFVGGEVVFLAGFFDGDHLSVVGRW